VVQQERGHERGTSTPSGRPPRDAAGSAGEAYLAYAQNAAQVVTDAVVLTLGDRNEMEDSTIAPIGLGWEPSWPVMGAETDAALDDLLESLPSGTPQS
jgi:hypothetical protein